MSDAGSVLAVVGDGGIDVGTCPIRFRLGRLAGGLSHSDPFGRF